MKLAIFLTMIAPLTVARPFGVHVIDDQTGRGVPLVELKSTSQVRFYTDSAGWIAIDDPAMLGHNVYFDVKSHGYEFPADGFGSHGLVLHVQEGAETDIKINRINIAQRLYRITGEGIYRDSVLLGKPAPISEPLLNGRVTGQDSAQCAIYQNKLWWFFGDTNDQAYKLGHFSTSGATSSLEAPDLSVGVNLKYFVNEKGFSRGMIPGKNGELHWLDGLLVARDDTGRERMVAAVARLARLDKVNSRAIVVFNDQTQMFDSIKEMQPKARLRLRGHPFRHTVDGVSYVYFGEPFANMRVRDEWKSIIDPATYEAYVPGEKGWSWQRGGNVSDRDEPAKPENDDSPFRLRDIATKKLVRAQSGSVCWNEYLKKWILIAVELRGSSSMLGEVWFSQADAPEGPWHDAVKIITHDRYSFYNPFEHPNFSQDAGRVIYFEGTYTATFSRDESEATPRYDYNQIMYRLDLGDPSLKLN